MQGTDERLPAKSAEPIRRFIGHDAGKTGKEAGGYAQSLLGSSKWEKWLLCYFCFCPVFAAAHGGESSPFQRIVCNHPESGRTGCIKEDESLYL